LGEDRQNLGASDASDGVHPDALPDARPEDLLLDADAEKLADREQGGQEMDDSRLAVRDAQQSADPAGAASVPEPCTPGADQSAGQSCVGRAEPAAAALAVLMSPVR
jgi:hypothetical protein